MVYLVFMTYMHCSTDIDCILIPDVLVRNDEIKMFNQSIKNPYFILAIWVFEDNSTY